MNARNFSILAILTVAVVVAAILLTQKEPVSSAAEKFFPNLGSVINEVTEINVNTKSESITLLRGEDWQWRIKEKYSYPASLEKVQNLLLGAVHLTIVEAKTSNPSSYAKIGVEDISEEEAQSTLLTFKKTGGETLLKVVIGNDRTAKIDSTRREIYVRKQDDKQAWLTLGQLPIENTLSNWLNQQIANIDSEKIRQINITHPEGDSLLVFKDSQKDEAYQLADLPDNAEVKLPYVLDNIATTLARLDFDDVAPVSESEVKFNDDETTRAVFTTFDGLEVIMTTTAKDGKHYAKFAAAFNQAAVVEPQKKDDEPASSEDKDDEPASSEDKGDEPASSEDKDDEPASSEDKDDEPASSEVIESQPEKVVETPIISAQKQAEKLNAKFKEWVYELSEYKVDDLAKTHEELISVSTPPAQETPLVEDIFLEGIEGLPIEELPSEFGTPSTSNF
jgi:hypothetical protein